MEIWTQSSHWDCILENTILDTGYFLCALYSLQRCVGPGQIQVEWPEESLNVSI